MTTPRAPASSPWAKIGAADTEDICRRLGAEYVAVWCRLSIIAAKTQSSAVVVSRRELGFDCGLSRATVRRHLDGLEREGFVTVERHRDNARGDHPNTYIILRGPYATPGQNLATPRGQNLTTPVYHGEGSFCEPPSQEYSSNTQERQETPSPSVAPKGASHFRIPSIEEIKAYASEIGSAVDPETFRDYYEANGWKVGRAPMKDWRAALRNWSHRGPAGTAPRRGQEVLEELSDGVAKVRLY